MRAKDSYDVMVQLDRIYNDNDFVIFGNIDKAVNLNEYRLDTFFSSLPKFYSRNRRSITIFSGEKNTVQKMISRYDNIKKIFNHVIDIDSFETDKIKEKVYKKIKKIGSLNAQAKKRIDEYIEKNYRKGTENEAEFIDDLYENIIYGKYKNYEINDDIKVGDLPVNDNAVKLESALERLNKLVGLNEVKQRVNEIRKYLEYQTRIGENKNINCNMVFKGNSGTGKTAVTKIMAEILYGMGITKTDKVVEVSGKDLIGSHLGETAPKTGKIVASAVRRNFSN